MKSPAKMITGLVSRIAGARDAGELAVGDLHVADVTLRQAHAAAEAEHGHLLSSWPPQAEILKSGDVELQKLAAEWVVQRGPAVVACLAGSIDVTPAGEIRIVRYSTLTDELGGLSLSALAALAPELVREGLAAVITRTPYDEGPPMAERAALVAEVKRKIEAIVKDHADLVDNAAAAGITLAHLPTTVGRRVRAAQARKRWEDDQSVTRDYYKRNPNARPPEPKQVAP